MSLPTPFTREFLGEKLYDAITAKDGTAELCTAILDTQKQLLETLRGLAPNEVPDSVMVPCKFPRWFPAWYDQYGLYVFRKGLHGEHPLYMAAGVRIGNSNYMVELRLLHKSRAETIEYVQSDAFLSDSMVRFYDLSEYAAQHEDDRY